MVTVLTDGSEVRVGAARAEGEDLWLPRADVRGATGWSLEDRGFCRDQVCVPTPPGREAEFVRDGLVNVTAFWRRVEGAVLKDKAGSVWMLGESANRRAARLQSLVAPDFTLPDLDGNPHSLRDCRGRKVLLVTWASW